MGEVTGSAGAGDHFAFVAQEIGALSIAGSLIALNAGTSNDDYALPSLDDFNVLEVS